MNGRTDPRLIISEKALTSIRISSSPSCFWRRLVRWAHKRISNDDRAGWDSMVLLSVVINEYLIITLGGKPPPGTAKGS